VARKREMGLGGSGLFFAILKSALSKAVKAGPGILAAGEAAQRYGAARRLFMSELKLRPPKNRHFPHGVYARSGAAALKAAALRLNLSQFTR
jgi:hypothetical protein